MEARERLKSGGWSRAFLTRTDALRRYEDTALDLSWGIVVPRLVEELEETAAKTMGEPLVGGIGWKGVEERDAELWESMGVLRDRMEEACDDEGGEGGEEGGKGGEERKQMHHGQRSQYISGIIPGINNIINTIIQTPTSAALWLYVRITPKRGVG